MGRARRGVGGVRAGCGYMSLKRQIFLLSYHLNQSRGHPIHVKQSVHSTVNDQTMHKHNESDMLEKKKNINPYDKN